MLKDSTIQGKIERDRFENQERSIHPDIPPCKDRIQGYKRRVFPLPDESRPESATTAVTSKHGGGGGGADTFPDENNTTRYPFK